MNASRAVAMSVTRAAADPLSAYQRVYEIVRSIPRGRVSTYGEIARAAGCSGPRQAGYALFALESSSDVPWHRVINARGMISQPGASAIEQRRRLIAEGVLSARGSRRIDLARYGWVAPAAAPAPALPHS